ncbi:hypothetical protein LINPERHAP1_LOCUS27132 [Linum perenne]
MFRARLALARLKHRQLCSSAAKPNNNKKEGSGDNGGDGNKQPSSVTRYNETYSKLGKLDFMTAAKILFTEPPKKKFGLPCLLSGMMHLFPIENRPHNLISVSGTSAYLHPSCFRLDFHLVQLFFVCLPSLAVYLVAMYARREMEKFEMDFQQKKKKEEETKTKEAEQKANEVEAKSNAALSEVKARLEQLEVAVKEIVVDKNKGKPRSDSSKTQSGTPSK